MEKEGEQQPCQLPILTDKDNNVEASDHVPLLVSETKLGIVALEVC
jgi:hypothetical protein